MGIISEQILLNEILNYSKGDFLKKKEQIGPWRYNTVIIDEAHTYTQAGSVLLAIFGELMRYRLSLRVRAGEQTNQNQEQEKGWLSSLHEMFPKNLKLIIMSATLDPIALSKLFPNNMFEVVLMPRRNNNENHHQRIIKHIRQPIKAIEYQNLALQTVLNV